MTEMAEQFFKVSDVKIRRKEKSIDVNNEEI